ncbi:MAG: type II secretion system protein [Elusimicrobiota bacterium]
MKHLKFRFLENRKAYTLVELMIVMSIISILFTIVSPRADLIFQKANQAKAKSNLGAVRSAINLYYVDHDGVYPLSSYPQGTGHWGTVALSQTLTPKYLSDKIPTPKLLDRMGSFNGLALSYDDTAVGMMASNPEHDVIIILGPANYTPLVAAPFAYDNQKGLLYYTNGNYTVSGDYFYQW